jgi:hypothetical protein
MASQDGAPDERELRAQECLAKAAFCEFSASVTVEQYLRDFYLKLVSEWKAEAAEWKKGNDR